MFNENTPIQANAVRWETRISWGDLFASVALAFAMPVALNCLFALIRA